MRKVEDKSKAEIVKIGRKIGAAFAEAEKKNIPCVLDADTPLKVKKYIHCGMKLCGEKKLKHGISLYTMAYNVPAEKRGCI